MEIPRSVHSIPSQCLLLFCFLPAIVYSQVKIPPKYDGFLFQNRPATTASVMIEAFFDPVCPDSRDSWAALKKALLHYGRNVTLVVHPFPLPYHDNSFVTSRALHIVNNMNTSATYHLLELFFMHQEQFYNKQSLNLTRESFVNYVSEFASFALGKSYISAIKSGFVDRRTDLKTRISFKYGCSRGVYGTPFFFVNGFQLPDGGLARNYRSWRKVIDPLIAKQENEGLHFL